MLVVYEIARCQFLLSVLRVGPPSIIVGRLLLPRSHLQKSPVAIDARVAYIKSGECSGTFGKCSLILRKIEALVKTVTFVRIIYCWAVVRVSCPRIWTHASRSLTVTTPRGNNKDLALGISLWRAVVHATTNR